MASAELLNFGLVGDSDGTTRLPVKAATNNSNYVSTLRNPNMEIPSITKAPRGDSSSPQYAPLPLTNKMAVGFETDSVVDVVYNPTWSLATVFLFLRQPLMLLQSRKASLAQDRRHYCRWRPAKERQAFRNFHAPTQRGVVASSGPMKVCTALWSLSAQDMGTHKRDHSSLVWQGFLAADDTKHRC